MNLLHRMKHKPISRAEAKAQGLKRYFTGKPCKYKHVATRFVSGWSCCECMVKYKEANKEHIAVVLGKYKEENKERIYERLCEYREENKELLAKRDRKYRDENKERVAEVTRKYRKVNKERIAEVSRKYREENKERLAVAMLKYREANKEKIATRLRKYRKENPLNVFTRKALERIERAMGKERINRAEVELKYTQPEFIQHIESQFTDGMSWENRSEWHIDHIKPLSLYLKEGETDLAIINALSNLQPLWATDNFSKGAKY